MLPDQPPNQAPTGRGMAPSWVSPSWRISAPPVSRQNSVASLPERLVSCERNRFMEVTEILEAATMSFQPRSEAMERTLTPSIEKEQVPPSELCWWALFGASGWWSCNSIFSELPLLMDRSPAGQRLGSHLSMMTQLGNLFLITFKAVEHKLELDAQKAVHIHVMMAAALVLLVCCSFSWDLVAFGTNLPLLVFMAFAGGVGCMSSATYWPIMIGFPRKCTKATSVGFSGGGVLATLLAALQMGGEGGPRWGVGVYFAVSALCQACMWLVVAAQLGRARQARAEEAAMVLLGQQEKQQQADDGAHTMLPGDLLKACNFCIHAAVYSVPSMLPFLASSYPQHVEKQAIVWMLVSQQCGETLGRFTAPVTDVRTLPAMAAANIASVWLFFITAALSPDWLAALVPTWLAVPVLAVSCFSCYFSFGILQTVLFVWALSSERRSPDAAGLSSNVGFLGQCGSLFGCFALWVSVNELALFGG
mmetsp:Transcript_95137/g.265737  ORF Transcript_95137/g.265737 Transcript_95137/m.265737 type:complete len:477 (+) Transcript_95137:77-1507(+)